MRKTGGHVRLNEVVAIEQGVKADALAKFNAINKLSQKPELFNGFRKKYVKKDEEGEDYPPESKLIQQTVAGSLTQARTVLTELLDIVGTLDYANCEAKADVTVQGQTLIANAPVTYLIFLEKQVKEIRTFLTQLPTLDPAEEWKEDVNVGGYKTDPVLTTRTKKIQRGLVLAPATIEHPAQTQLITEDVVAGTWETIKLSAAMAETRKQELLTRVNILLQAIKAARAQGNMADAPSIVVGEALFSYLFA